MDKQTEYVERISAEIVEWDLQIEQLRDKLDSATSETSSGYAAEIAALQTRRDEAAFRLQGISPVTDDGWGDIKTGSEGVMDEVRSMVSDAIMKIS